MFQPKPTDHRDESLAAKLVEVRRFRGLFEAQLAKASLDGVDIQCFLADDNMVRMDWFVSDAIGGDAIEDSVI